MSALANLAYLQEYKDSVKILHFDLTCDTVSNTEGNEICSFDSFCAGYQTSFDFLNQTINVWDTGGLTSPPAGRTRMLGPTGRRLMNYTSPINIHW